MLSDAAILDFNDNSLNETSVLDDDVIVDSAIGDDSLTFDDYEEHPDDEAPLYVGVPQRNILSMNDTLTPAEVELLHLTKNTNCTWM